MAMKPVTVSQLNEYIGRIMSTDPILGNITVVGEASGVKYHSTGHIYFSVIDGESKLNCFFNRDYVPMLRFELTDGMEVVLSGSVTVFKKNGTYSLYVKNIEVSGEGSLAIAADQLKAKLDKEGLFDPAHKKQVPQYPKKIGIVTSETGAAVRDILKILATRNPNVGVIVFPVLVQGHGAAADIAGMIDYINENYEDIDTLIVGRGGGSIEDLWAFNEEVVARSIYNSRIPIISAVGHEIDFTIADMVADLRAETPTAAASLAVTDLAQLKANIDGLADDLLRQLVNKLDYQRLRVDNLYSDIKISLEMKLNRFASMLENYRIALQENNPELVLAKGYSILTDENKRNIKSVGDLIIGGNYSLKLSDGDANCQITQIKKNAEGEISHE